jgi:GNAT superfamily N-acetyltransferase
LLNVGKHPVFVGEEMVSRNAVNGGLWFAVDTVGVDIGVALIDPKYSNLLVMSVHPQARGRGIGKHIVRFLAPNYIRSVESAEPFFAALGYVAVGDYFQGRKLRTRILVREDVLRLAGRLRTIWPELQTSA